jgi:hypothetical protein
MPRPSGMPTFLPSLLSAGRVTDRSSAKVHVAGAQCLEHQFGFKTKPFLAEIQFIEQFLSEEFVAAGKVGDFPAGGFCRDGWRGAC